MGNTNCPPQDAAHLASVARSICPFPNYNPSPLFVKMLSINSSVHLRDHYTAVQSSLTPKQLEDFTQGLRSTFGKKGKVTHGGMGVVALSLAVLFDTLANKARGETVSDSGPIPGLFVKDLREYYSPHVYTASEYLRLVPHIANNPSRMMEESERYLKQLIIDFQSLDKGNHILLTREDTGGLNLMLGQLFAGLLEFHLREINSTANVQMPSEPPQWYTVAFMRMVPEELIVNLNCDPKVADKDFLSEVQQSEKPIQEAFEKCKPENLDASKPWLLHVAQLEWVDVIYGTLLAISRNGPEIIDRREAFDLKTGALGKWAE